MNASIGGGSAGLEGPDEAAPEALPALCSPGVDLLLALGLLALGVVRVLLGYPRSAERFENLSRREIAFVAAAAEATFPPGGAIEPSGCEAGIPRYVDRFVGALPRRTRVLIRLLFLCVEHATLVFPAPGLDGWRRFTALGPAQQVAALQGWERSRFALRRFLFASLRAILTMGYLSSPAVLRRLHLAPLSIPTPLRHVDLLYPPLGAARMAIRWTPADLTPPSDGAPLDPGGPVHPDYAERRP